MSQEFSRESLPSDPESWPLYRKTALTHALRVDGEFTVQTRRAAALCGRLPVHRCARLSLSGGS